MMKWIAGFIGAYILYLTLPYQYLAQASFFNGIKPHHLQHKLGIALTAAFLIWVIVMTIKMCFQSLRNISNPSAN